MAEQNRSAANREASRSAPNMRLLWWLGTSAFLSWWLYVALTWLSVDFAYEVDGEKHPLVPMLVIFAVLFALYLLQVAIVKRISAKTVEGSSRTMPLIVVFCFAFRLLLLFSEPIQEVDIYRYMWDGKVLAAGVSPFRYSPLHIKEANASQDHNSEVDQLIELRDRSFANDTILQRIHYPELTTVYPPVSQAVFGFAALITPDSTSVQNHLFIMKSLIVAFDLGTFGLLVLILKYVRRPPEWSVAYGWCPLVMKEFANSGHLDSITIFLSVLTAYCALRAFYPRADAAQIKATKQSGTGNHNRSSQRWTLVTAIVLAMAVGAKIYPIILAPLLFLLAWQKVGRIAAVTAGIIVLTLTIVMVDPMLSRDQPTPELTAENSEPLPPPPTVMDEWPADHVAQSPTANPDQKAPEFSILDTRLPAGSLPENKQLELPQLPAVEPKLEATGLTAFTTHWQMNDFLFLLVAENLRGANQGDSVWFAVTPVSWREFVISQIAEKLSIEPKQVPFLATRFITSLIFLVLAVWFAWRTMKSESAEEWLEAVFLTIAWFWLLLPTQNPWYWAWAMPFLPFARSRAWLAVSGLVLVYYVRFWLLYHASETEIANTPYKGEDFFHYVIIWFEFGPWFLWLAWTAMNHNARKKRLS